MTHRDSRTGPGFRSLEPRRYTIRSHFGNARERRSRKSRPCDVCRKRKTACVIPVEPPCVFCRNRGLACESSIRLQASPDLGVSTDMGSLPPEPSEQSRFMTRNELPCSTAALVLDNHASLLTGTEHQALPGNESASLAQERSDSFAQPSYILSETSETNVLVNPSTLSLEDIGNRTAHHMGLAAEQDTNLLDVFRSVIISDTDEVDAGFVRVDRGGSRGSEPPIHFLLLENEFPEHTNRAMQTASDAIEAIVFPHGLSLIRLYFTHVHPAYPVLSKTRFLRQYSSFKEKIPASLRGAVYALASAFWYRDASLETPCPFPQHELVGHAHASLRRELEAPNLYKLQACLLLLHPRAPDIDTVETPSTWILASQATACAQMIGLHRDPASWDIAPWEKSLRKKLWWGTYITDCWSAVCHGNPAHINSHSFDTSALGIDDVRVDEDVTEDLVHLLDASEANFRISDGVRFLQMIELSHSLRSVIDCSFQINSSQMLESEAKSSRNELVVLRKGIEDWPNLIPHCLGAEQRGHFEIHWNAPLHLSFYAVQVLLYRGLMHPATKEAKATRTSNLRCWFPAALQAFQTFTEFMGNLKEADISSFWPRHARTQLILCGNFLIYLFLLASESLHVQAAFRLLESFHQTLQRLGVTENIDARLLLRPVMLRIDSFFTQAADLLKRGSTGHISSPAVTI